MKILVLSDSHSAISFMRQCVNVLHPDAIIHLGDHYDDGEVLHEENPGIPFYQVPGNCDRYRCIPGIPEIRIERILGINAYLTHGHHHKVKQYLGLLLRDARASKVDVVLYGHTHVADCHREEDGLWVLNPGSCGYYGGTAGLVTVEQGKIMDCSILSHGDLASMSV